MSEFSFIMPALCFAISKISFPSISTWSYPILPITFILPFIIFVQSFSPPNPASTIAKSHFLFAKYIIASAVIASNHFTGTLCFLLYSSIALDKGINISSTSSSEICLSFIQIPSLNLIKCGEINFPHFIFCII